MSSPSLHVNSATAPSLGYFAFPPNLSGSALNQNATLPLEDPEQKAEERRQKRASEEYNARLLRDAELHKARIMQEEAEALRGEEDWVRSGGILRDTKGRRDFARTEAMREELRLRDLEKMLNERWEQYEQRWRALNGKGKHRGAPYITFTDVPWPVVQGSRPMGIRDLTVERVEEFLLGNLRVRGCKVTRKERVRSSLLRWHPDKLTALVSSVVEKDRDAVIEGITTVVRCLHQLNTS